MSLGTDFYDYLLADVEIAAAVGNDSEGTAKVYHQQIPQGEDPPYLYFQQITGANHHHYGAASGIASSLWQLDCVGLGGTTDAATIAEAVRHRIDGYSGTMGATAVQAVFVNTSREMTESTGDSSEDWISRVILDVEVWNAQSVPTG